MQMLFRFLVLLIGFNAYSQKQDIIPLKPPLKPLKSYRIKIENTNGKCLHLYNDAENIPLIGKYEIELYFLDSSKKDTLINENGRTRMTLQYDLRYSCYSSSNLVLIGNFNNGYKDGLWKTQTEDKNKLVKTINYKNGLVIGRYRVYDTKGNLLYKTTFGAKGNGKFKDYYYKTGVLKQEGNYENGKKEGEWYDYDEQGIITKTTNYNKGMPQEE